MDNIGKIKSQNNNELKYVVNNKVKIGIPIQEFNEKFKNIYISNATINAINEKNKRILSYELIFKNINKDMEILIDLILDSTINTQKKITLYETLIEIENIFDKKYFNDKIISMLLGDIGECISIILLEEQNIQWQKYYQKTDFCMFDYSFNDFFLEIKTTTTNKASILAKNNQLFTHHNVFFLVIQVEKISGKKNIIDLLKMIKNKNSFIINKIKLWENLFYNNKEIINSWTTEIEKKNYFLLNNFEILNESYLNMDNFDPFMIPINIKKAKKISFDNFINKIKDKKI